MPGHMGGRRVTQRGLEVVEIDAERNLLCRRGAVPGPQERHGGGAEVELMATKATASRPDARQAAKADLPAGVFGEAFHETLVHETARADLAARRRGTASTPAAARSR